MSDNNIRETADLLIAFWQGEEVPSIWCRPLAEHLEASLRSPVSRSSGLDLREDRETLEAVLSGLAQVDPVVRDLVRKITGPQNVGLPAGRVTPVPTWDRSRPGLPSTRAERNPHSVAEPAPRIQVGTSSGMIVAGDLSTSGPISWNTSLPAATPTPAPEVEVRKSLPDSQPIRILFLGADPRDKTRLRLDEEVRDIDSALRQGKFRDSFEFRQQWAVRISDLQRALLQHEPQILHFSGHGSQPSSAIYLEDASGEAKKLQKEALAGLMSVFEDQIRCVVLNACYSQGQAEAIAEHIDCVIGMSSEIGDQSAIAFSSSFYQALAFGKDVQKAFRLGCQQIQLFDLMEEHKPKLIAVRCDPAKVVFAVGR